MNFRSVAQLSDQLLRWSRRLPPDIEVVVGIPRSGLLVANLLALYRNLPMTDVEGLLAGRTLGHGRRRLAVAGGGAATEDGAAAPLLATPRKVLVVDDSLDSGQSLRDVRERIEAAGLGHDVVYGAVYVTPGQMHLVDYHCELLLTPRAFEWNIMHHNQLKRSCLDFDGVLCADPTDDENGSPAAYEAFLANARAHHLPTDTVGWIVTSRIEKYRPQTEAWLRANGVEYNNLIMLDYPDGDLRRKMGIHSAFKAEVYRSVDAVLFLESSIRQAYEISVLSGKDVLCTDTMQLIRPGSRPVERFSAGADVLAPSLARRVVRSALPLAMRKFVTDRLRRRRRRATAAPLAVKGSP